MTRRTFSFAVVFTLAACGSEPEPAKSSGAASAQPSSTRDASPQPTPAQPTTAAPTEQPELEPPQPAPPEPAPPEPPATDGGEPIDPEVTPPSVTPPATEIAIHPWAATPFTPTWTLAAEPSEALALVLELDAGVLGRAGATWHHVGADGKLVVAEMDVEPKLPIVGVWPSDAWFVDSKIKKEDEMEIEYIRLMKLRGGNRWVPQVFSGDGEQWFHPGTDDWLEPHMSTRSGMLIYPGSLREITRVAGKHEDPILGLHRGKAVDFIEAGSGNIYVISWDDGFYAQIACEDEACVAEKAQKLPDGQWKFGRKASRGKHSVSVLASNETRGEFILHHRGKSDGWLLDELLPGEKPQGMWASEEGGLWTLTGEKLRWRDTESVWRDMALPEGMTGPSVALSEDRKQVWVSGLVGGAAKVFTTNANAEPATP
jgi:hypothetical protein